MKSNAILIPARYGSTRYPAKPLAMLDGVPMIRRVYDACIASKIPTYVLTDNKTIAQCIQSAGGKVYIDSKDYANGTERCAGAIKSSLFDEYDNFINVQGDMPDVTPEMIEQCFWHLQHYPITTLYTEMKKDLQNDPNSVKLIRSGDKCLWFGRGMTGYGDWHLGVYGYRRNPLEYYMTYEIEQEERVEKLEQLRWLKAGWDIGCIRVDFDGIEINAPEDVEQWHNKNFH